MLRLVPAEIWNCLLYEGDLMKIFNEYVVGTSMLLIGGAFFSPRFADILVYPLGNVPDMIPLIGGANITVGRVIGIIPLSIGLSVLTGKILGKSIPVVEDIAAPSIAAMGEGALEGAFGAETEVESVDKKWHTKSTTRRKAKHQKVKHGISTDTSKQKGKFKPWQQDAKITKNSEGGSWTDAVSQARKELGITGFQAIKKGTPLYKRAKKIYGR